MCINIVLFGDEIGLLTLDEVINQYSNMVIKAIIVNEYRLKANKIGKQIAKKNNCPLLFLPIEINSYDEFCEKLKGISPDLGICYSFDRIINPKILDVFKGQIFNIHGALLPKYRGANVLNWVLINDEKKTGVTIHQMTPELDSGAIAVQREISISEEDTALTLREKLDKLSILVLNIFLQQVISGEVVLRNQDESQVTYVKRRQPEDGFFSWDQDTRHIYNLIRALVKPWPGAWFIENGEKRVIDYYMSFEEVVKLKQEYTVK